MSPGVTCSHQSVLSAPSYHRNAGCTGHVLGCISPEMLSILPVSVPVLGGMCARAHVHVSNLGVLGSAKKEARTPTRGWSGRLCNRSEHSPRFVLQTVAI